jgi:hypothetical protein
VLRVGPALAELPSRIIRCCASLWAPDSYPKAARPNPAPAIAVEKPLDTAISRDENGVIV